MHIVITSQTTIIAAPPADFCSLPQIAAGAPHRLNLELDDDLRPLARAGLAAIHRAADDARALLPAAAFNASRSMS